MFVYIYTHIYIYISNVGYIYIWVIFIYTNKLAMYIHGLQYTTYFLGCTSDHWAFWQDLEYIVVPHIIKSYLEGDQEVHLGSLRQPDMAMQKKVDGKIIHFTGGLCHG